MAGKYWSYSLLDKLNEEKQLDNSEIYHLSKKIETATQQKEDENWP